jgi:hypothetical protein
MQQQTYTALVLDTEVVILVVMQTKHDHVCIYDDNVQVPKQHPK